MLVKHFFFFPAKQNESELGKQVSCLKHGSETNTFYRKQGEGPGGLSYERGGDARRKF